MSLELKNKKLIRLIFVLTICPLLSILIFFWARSSIWSIWDYKALDVVYRLAVEYGYGPEMSNQIIYIPITDKTYSYFEKNILSRADLAMVNDALNDLDIEALIFDIIFARQSNLEDDERFEKSIKQLGSVYLPIGLAYSENKKSFKWEGGKAYERFKSDYLNRPVEKGFSKPYYGVSALMQTDNFSMAALNSGHISSFIDTDGVYRHMIMLLKVDDLYFPSIALSVFLDFVGVSFDEIIVHWGKEIIIPSIKGSYLDHDILIPIDERGRTFIPYAQIWQNDYKKMEAQRLIEYSSQEDLQGNLREFFEGKFVFIGDISIGIADLGQTPLERNVPLLITHTSILNALLTNTFYKKLSFTYGMVLVPILIVLLGVSALSKRTWILYCTGVIILGCIIIFTWIQFLHFNLFPVATLSGSVLIVFFTLVIGIQIAVSKERSFIKNTFSKYMPQKVVNHLLENPALLKLGGEERVVTVLFSDLVGFTTISENMSPPDLINFLNEYLTEMTNIVFEEGGIIDKYHGDAIMAEFGVPIHIDSHADMAVRTGLRMQRRLKDMRKEWLERQLPELHCRIGINTGPMIIGNMGSNRLTNYTVIGDAVNLASRLEGANKRYNTFLMISEYTYESLTRDMFKTRILDIIKVKGKSKAVRVYEVYGDSSDKFEDKNELYYHIYHEAFEAYLSQSFASARNNFLKALSLRPDDPASKDMITRIDALIDRDLPTDWDGSLTLTLK